MTKVGPWWWWMEGHMARKGRAERAAERQASMDEQLAAFLKRRYKIEVDGVFLGWLGRVDGSTGLRQPDGWYALTADGERLSLKFDQARFGEQWLIDQYNEVRR